MAVLKNLGLDLMWRPRKETKRLIIHGGHTAHQQGNLAAWLTVNGRKAGLLEIGYHYVIFSDGRQLYTRPHNVMGTHTPGFDRDSIGVYLAGGLKFRCGPDGEDIPYQCDDFTPAQWETVAGLYEYLKGHYPELELVGHSELGRYRFRSHMCPPVDFDKMRERCKTAT